MAQGVAQEGETSVSLIVDVPVSPEDAGKAEKLKEEANALFSTKKYDLAIDKYSEAISYNPKVPAYYTNRAYCYIRTECFGYAIRDANKALELDGKFVKAYYRRAVAHMALLQIKEALKDFKLVCSVAPNDRDAQMKLAECTKEFKRLKFEAAIASDEVQRSALDIIGDIESIVIDTSYEGPVLESDQSLLQKADVLANDSKATSAIITLPFIEKLMTHFEQQKKLHKKVALQIMVAAKENLAAQPAMESIEVPEGSRLTICGDVHGQYYDLLNIFKVNGLPSKDNWYLFNGDFVDRGSFSVEIMLTLLAFRWLYPNYFFLSRGNHETDNMNKVYGFEGEVKAKFSEATFSLFSEIFNAIPVANYVQKRVLVVHGGLPSTDNVSLDDIRKIDRFRQPPSEGLMSDLLWTDPQPENGRSPSKRGVGMQFGPDVTAAFCKLNDLDCIIRSHECKDEGYTIEHSGQCITVFSAPNYCDNAGNKGAFIHLYPKNSERREAGQKIEETLNFDSYYLDFVKFSAVPHPPVKPMQYASGFMNRLGLGM